MPVINNSDLIILGNAKNTGNQIRLTDASERASGAVQFNDSFILDNMKSINFNAKFSFRMGNGFGNDVDGPGGSGITFFVAPKVEQALNFGGAIGYGGINNSIAVEFDTFSDPFDILPGSEDLNGNHIGLNIDGQMTSVSLTPVEERMNDDEFWNVWIDYDAKDEKLEIRLSKDSVKPIEATMTNQINLLEVLPLNEDLYFGFSSGTGVRYEYHDILSSEITFEEVFENTAPVVNDNSTTINEDSVTTLNILNNDTDADGDTLVVSKVNSSTANVGSKITLSSGAFLTVNADGTTTYDPNGKFDYLNDGETASDSFTYEASDGNGGTDTATVTIIINGEGSIITNPNGPVNFIGNNYDETIRSGNGSDRINARAGNDTINTGGGDDNIRSGEGNDIIDAGDGNDRIYGNLGDDTIYSGMGNDYVSGGEGNDKIFSSLGNDIHRGGEDSDMFIYTDFNHSTKIEEDLIIDFEKGIDKIDFSDLGIESFDDITIKKIFSTGIKVNITIAEDADFSLDVQFTDFIAGTQLAANDFIFAPSEAV
jgi:VCBS repeat-containing protein